MKKYLILSSVPLLAIAVMALAKPSAVVAAVNCPLGYTCTLNKVICPVGFICTPNATIGNASNAASATNALSAMLSAIRTPTPVTMINNPANTANTANTTINCPPEVADCTVSDTTNDVETHPPVASTTLLNSLSSYANYATLPYTNSTSTRSGCSVELSFENANLISNLLQLNQTQQASVVSPSTLHVKDIAYSVPAVRGGKDYGKSPKAKFLFDVCLGSGYASNIPAGVDANRIITLNTPSTQWIVLNNPDYSTTTNTSHN